jgi:hypothetical protein
MTTKGLHGVVNDCNMTTCVLNDYKMTTYFYFKCKSMWTLHISCFGHDFTPCHVELLKQVIHHNSSDHSYLIQYDYKYSCKLSCFFPKILLVYSCFFLGLVPTWLVV